MSSTGCWYTIMCYEYSGQTQKSFAPIMTLWRAFRVTHTHTGGMWTEKSCLSHAWLLLWALLVHRWAPALMPQQQEVRYCVQLCVLLSYCREKKNTGIFSLTQWTFCRLKDILCLITNCKAMRGVFKCVIYYCASKYLERMTLFTLRSSQVWCACIWALLKKVSHENQLML